MSKLKPCIEYRGVHCDTGVECDLCLAFATLRARVVEGIEVVEAIQALPPERIGSREYGWMRDWLTQALAALAPAQTDDKEGTT